MPSSRTTQHFRGTVISLGTRSGDGRLLENHDEGVNHPRNEEEEGQDEIDNKGLSETSLHCHRHGWEEDCEENE